MNGADRLCDTLLANGVDVCFANPGTSEMHFVAALDRKPQMRCVLGLFEGVVTGAAYGYGVMAGRPAATLLHTGPGLANGLANLHNARRAPAPVLNVVGDHASYHLKYDAPLTTDIESLAAPMSDWVRRISGPADVQSAVEAGYLAALAAPGVATLILPADAAWGALAEETVTAIDVPSRPRVPADRVRDVAQLIRSHRGRFGILVGPGAASNPALESAGRIAEAFGGEVFTEVLPARVQRGRETYPAVRIPYPIDAALATLADIDLLVLAGAREPVAFFAYPGKPSRLLRAEARAEPFAGSGDDLPQALADLCYELDAPARQRPAPSAPPELPQGTLTEDAIAVVLASLLPEGSVIASEAATSAARLFALGAGGPSHDVLVVTGGGAIGAGIPVALGAAIACPDRKVINVQADGSGMYTLQGLWSMARERCDVLVVVCSNRRYAILQGELKNLGVTQVGRNASRMMSLDDPPLDWVALARGMGVEGARVDTCEGFADVAGAAMRRRGPFLIECVI